MLYAFLYLVGVLVTMIVLLVLTVSFHYMIVTREDIARITMVGLLWPFAIPVWVVWSLWLAYKDRREANV